MNNKKLLIFTILFVLLYFLISIINNLFVGEKFKNTIFLGNNTKIQINEKNIVVKDENTKVKRQKVKIYYKKNIIDGYISNSDNESTSENNYSVTNNEGIKIILDSPLLAYTPDLSIKVIDSKILNNVDLEDVYKFANENNISLSKNITMNFSNIKVFKLNNEDLYIYSVGLIEDEEKYYSIVFMKKGENYYLIEKADSTYLDVDGIGLNFFSIIDFNDDGEYEFVVEKMMSEYGPAYYELYNFKGNKFTRIGGE